MLINLYSIIKFCMNALKTSIDTREREIWRKIERERERKRERDRERESKIKIEIEIERERENERRGED